MGSRTGVGQVLASADRLATWAVRDAAFYGFDPHFYGWPTPSFQAQVDNVAARMAQAGIGGHPFIINTGEERTRTIPTPRRDRSRRCGLGWVEQGARFLFATWWYRARVVNGKAADERFDSSPRSLAALPDVLRRRVTHPGSLTGSAEWVTGASRAARGSVVHIPVMSSFDRIFAWGHASEHLRRAS